MRSSLVLFFVLIIQVLTSVATNPTPSSSTPSTSAPRRPKPKKFRQGDIIRVPPSAWEKGEGKPINRGSQTPHFGVVVGKNPNNNKYKVVHISHNLPASYPHRDDASKYHPKADKHSMINTGTPKEVGAKDLQRARGWNKMKHDKLTDLKAEITKNCPGSLRRRGLGCPSRNAPKGQSRQPQGKKAGSGPKPNQKSPKGQLRQFKVGANKAPKVQMPQRQLQGKKAGPGPKPAPQSKSRPLGGKKI